MEKLEWCRYPTIKKFRRYLYSFWRDPRTWQTDGQTDGRTLDNSKDRACIASRGKKSHANVYMEQKRREPNERKRLWPRLYDMPYNFRIAFIRWGSVDYDIWMFDFSLSSLRGIIISLCGCQFVTLCWMCCRYYRPNMSFVSFLSWVINPDGTQTVCNMPT